MAVEGTSTTASAAADRSLGADRTTAKVIAFTSFDEQGEFDRARLQANLDRFADAGLDIILVGEGSGELSGLRRNEVSEVLLAASEHVRGRTDVVALGGCPRSAQEQLEFVTLVAAAECKSVGLYPLLPAHNARPSEEQLESFYRTVLGATDLAVTLSFYTPLHSYTISPALIGRVTHEFDNVVAIQGGGNAHRNDVTYLSRIIDAVRPGVGVYSAGPHHALTNLALGGVGFACGEANLIPWTANEVIAANRRGDTVRLQRAFRSLVRVQAITERYGAVASTKALCDNWGVSAGPVRPPLRPLADEAMAQLLAEPGLDEIRLWETELQAAAADNAAAEKTTDTEKSEPA